MTAARLSREIDISQESMRKWWRGLNKPTLENIEKIAEVLNVDLSELVGDAKRTTRSANEEAIEKYIEGDGGQDLDDKQREQLRLCTTWLPYDKRPITQHEIHELANVVRLKTRRDEMAAKPPAKNRPA